MDFAGELRSVCGVFGLVTLLSSLFSFLAFQKFQLRFVLSNHRHVVLKGICIMLTLHISPNTRHLFA